MRSGRAEMSADDHLDAAALGPNMWLIDEMYRRFRRDPDEVGEAWRDFFADFTPALGAAEPAPAPAKPAPAKPSPEVPPGAEQLRFGRERIVRNMEASLELPTATSFRIIPAKL